MCSPATSPNLQQAHTSNRAHSEAPCRLSASERCAAPIVQSLSKEAQGSTPPSPPKPPKHSQEEVGVQGPVDFKAHALEGVRLEHHDAFALELLIAHRLGQLQVVGLQYKSVHSLMRFALCAPLQDVVHTES